MLEIDGSYGEGGGQIVRTAVSLSSVTGKPVRIRNIRQGRPKPGLAAQHVQAVKALALICSARTEGLSVGSTEIAFSPGEVRGGEFRIDIGTAGSVTLLMQCLMPGLTRAKDRRAKDRVTLRIFGGTDVRWSPSIDYFRYVFLPAVEMFGVKAELECLHRGYYPRGGGSVILNVSPSELMPAHLDISEKSATGPVSMPASRLISGMSHCSNLPEHVARRQADSASGALKDAGFESRIDVRVLEEASTGSGITLWSGFKGSDALGERGVRAETVGITAAGELIRELKSGSVVDVHLADQLVPYIALAGGSYTTAEISKHTSTNIWTVGRFLDRDVKISDGEVFRIEA